MTQKKTKTKDKRQKDKRQTMISKSLNIKLKIEQHEPYWKQGVNSGSPWTLLKAGSELRLSMNPTENREWTKVLYEPNWKQGVN